MKLYEIIEANEKDNISILIELLVPYKKSLFTYYSRWFCSEPVLMVTMVANAVQYAKIVPANEFAEAMDEWVNADNTLSDEDKEDEKETINFNSIMLKDL